MVVDACVAATLHDWGYQVVGVDAAGAMIVSAGEWVQYSTPSPEGAEYIAVCLPAFSPSLVHRDLEV